MLDLEKLLTIAIPTYNRCAILLETLGNIISQLRDAKIQDAVSIRIVDNCSTDDTLSRVSLLVQSHPDIDLSIRRNGQNFGVDKNMDLAARASSTEWTWLLCDDDRITPG